MSNVSLPSGKANFSLLKRREALPESIASSVAQAIALRNLIGGERVFENVLAEQFGVSRVPVREALQILHTQGIIEGGGHRGYRVASFSDEMIHSVYEARVGLETLFLRDAIKAWQAGRSDLEVLNAAIEAMHRAEKTGEVGDMLDADLAFHTAICDAAQNPLYSKLWSVIARHVLIILTLSRGKHAKLDVTVRRHETLRDQFREMISQPGIADPRTVILDHFNFPVLRPL
jgi:DNA-binding GntR family transcriptional regulator